MSRVPTYNSDDFDVSSLCSSIDDLYLEKLLKESESVLAAGGEIVAKNERENALANTLREKNEYLEKKLKETQEMLSKKMAKVDEKNSAEEGEKHKKCKVNLARITELEAYLAELERENFSLKAEKGLKEEADKLGKGLDF